MTGIFVLIGFIVFLALATLFFFVSRYKRCPSDKILVVYGKTGGESSSKCYAGGAAFVWPVIQDYQYLDLTPLSIDVNLKDALSKQNIRVSVPSQFTVGISNKPKLMIAAAERLLGQSREQISSLSHDIIMGQMRLVIANMDIEELNTDRDKFVESVYTNVGDELHKIGLELINVNVTDIQDESGYIQALGKEAAAKAINDARVKVAQEVRTGSIGEAEAQQDQRIKVSDANMRAEVGEAVAQQSQRVKVAESNSLAEIGEAEAKAVATKGMNQSEIEIANSNAARDIEIAEAERKAVAAKRVSSAKAMEEAYEAEESKETARAKMIAARKEADEVVEADIQRKKAVIRAQAESERQREIAKGEADAIYSKLSAQAKGTEELLAKQAHGFQKLVEAANGDPKSAIGYLMVDKLAELAEIQAKAISNVSLDKVIVYDSGNGEGVGNFVKGLYGMMPMLNDFMSQSGMNIPEALTKKDEVKPLAIDAPEKAVPKVIRRVVKKVITPTDDGNEATEVKPATSS